MRYADPVAQVEIDRLLAKIAELEAELGKVTAKRTRRYRVESKSRTGWVFHANFGILDKAKACRDYSAGPIRIVDRETGQVIWPEETAVADD